MKFIQERETLSIVKPDSRRTSNACISILAAANPIKSHWNKSKRIIENIGLTPTLLSHFDLTFLLLDPQDEGYDRRLAQHLISSYQYGNESKNTHDAMVKSILAQKENHLFSLQDTDLFRDYISYAHSYVSPQLTELADKRINS